MDQKLYSCVYSSGKAWRERCADMYVLQMIPRAVPDMYMRAYPRLCRAILGVLYICVYSSGHQVHKALPSSNRLA